MKKIFAVTVALLTLLHTGTGFAACSATPLKPDGQYLDNGDGTVTDNETGLMWQQCLSGMSGAGCATGTAATYNWMDAFAAVQAANAISDLGYSDWRLPNIKELASLGDRSCSGPYINNTLFPNGPNGDVWSSTADQRSAFYYVAFTLNTSRVIARPKNMANYVRMVRAGN
jgi:hypothetical protein